ncbi:MAG: glucose 1-dehydrogenase [bacterium]
MDDAVNLEGNVALVTGAARRVGRAFALELAARGADLIVLYRARAPEALEVVGQAAKLGRRAVALRAEVSHAKEVSALVSEALREFGRLDILVNNASIFSRTPFAEMSEQDWDRLLDVNLKGAFLFARAAAPTMLRQGAGKIINIADITRDKPVKGYLAYSVSKAGLVTLTKALAVELAPSVQVNAIGPGPVLFPEDFSEDLKAKVIARTPLKRTGSPEDIARAVRFLIEEGDFITGILLPVDGGMSVR